MTTLYIKTHNVTGLKYFGKTTQEDYHKYKGSGTHWKSHIAVHGYDVTTEFCAQFDETDPNQRALLVEYALEFSEENNIVKSKEWANLIPENGIDGGGIKGKIHIYKGETKKMINPEDFPEYQEAGWIKGRIKGNIYIHKGKTEKRINPDELSEYQLEGWIRGRSDEANEINSKAQTGKTQSKETIAKKISITYWIKTV